MGLVEFRVNNREFQETLNRYAALSRRTPAQVVNKKAYYITRRAIWHTPKTDQAKVIHQLEANEAFELHINKSGKNKGKYSRAKKFRTFVLGSGQNPNVPRVVKILVARLKKRNREIPPMAELLARGVKMVKARLRSIAFLKSGWIPAREAFRAAGGGGGAGLPPNEPSSIGGPKVIGRPKGRALVANEWLWKARAVFTNLAAYNEGNRDALVKYGGPALQQAFNEETGSTMAEVEKRLRAAAKQAGIKTN